MDENAETDISEHYQTPLSSLALPDHYNKLIKRIKNFNFSEEGFNVETVGDIVEFEPHQFSSFKGVGNHYVETLIEFKKELPFFLNNLKQEPNSVFIEDIFTTPDNSYKFETPINQLALSPKYQKLIKRISAVMGHVKTVQDIIHIDVASFSKLPYVGKSYVDLLIYLQNALSPKNSSQSNNNVIKEIELPPRDTSKLYINYGFLSEKEIKQLKKLEKFYEDQIDIRNVNTLLSLDKVVVAKF